MNILIVLTSVSVVPGTERKTGTWLEEFVGPYYAFTDAGAQVVVASPHGGAAPIDPYSEDDAAQTAATHRFSTDAEAQHVLANTVPLSSIDAKRFDAVFYSGGLGPVFDLTHDTTSVALIESMFAAGKPVAAVCHGVAALRDARAADGKPLVAGHSVAGFSNSEEQAAHGVGVVPFLIEDELRRLGGHYSSAADWHSHVITDGHLITGQNPASSVDAALRVLQALS